LAVEYSKIKRNCRDDTAIRLATASYTIPCGHCPSQNAQLVLTGIFLARGLFFFFGENHTH